MCREKASALSPGGKKSQKKPARQGFVAFQLADDVIDLSPASDATGKKAGTDLKAGVPTLPTLLLERVVDTDPEAASLLTRLRDDAWQRPIEYIQAVAGGEPLWALRSLGPDGVPRTEDDIVVIAGEP